MNAQIVKKMAIQAVVDDPEWQSLRKSLVGTWKNTPADNCRRLEEYLGDWKDPLKVRRILNYLTGSGFRLGVITHPNITDLRAKVRICWHQMCTQPIAE